MEQDWRKYYRFYLVLLQCTVWIISIIALGIGLYTFLLISQCSDVMCSISFFTIAAIVSFGSNAIYYFYEKIGQKRRDEHAAYNSLRIGSGENFRYALFLRPFAIKDEIYEDVNYGSRYDYMRGYYNYGSDYTTRISRYDFELQIIAALRGLPVIAFGKPGETIGVGRVLSNDSDWWEKVSYHIERASLIVCIPSAQPGTLQELDKIIKERYLGKTVFIMPPKDRVDTPKWRQDWPLVSNFMRLRGIEFPDYSDYSRKRSRVFLTIHSEMGSYNGIIFRVMPEGKFVAEELHLTAARKIKRSIRRLVALEPSIFLHFSD
jgi:hypothetical protein